MIRLRIAVHTASLRGPLRSAIETAASLGAEAIQIDARSELRPSELSQTGLRQFRKLLADRNLRVAAVTFNTRRGYDVLEDLDRRVTATREAMQMAGRLGAPVVVNQIGSVPEDREGRPWQALVEVLTDLGLFGSRCGARLSAETGNDSGPRLAELLRAVPEGTITATLDPGNLIVNGISIIETIEALGDNIAHVHATDATRDRSAGRALNVPLGQGAVDYPGLLASLEEHDYRGVLCIGRSGSSDPATEIESAIRYLRGL